MKLLWIHNIWIVLVIVFVLVVGFLGERRKLKRLRTFAHENRHGAILSLLGRRFIKTRRILLVLAFLFSGFSALGPTYGYTLRPIRHTGIDIVFLLDVSRSMLASDLRPSRLERAKRDIKGLLELLTGERVGLVVFSGSPVLLCPLTHDYEAFEELLSRALPSIPAMGGTDLGAGLKASLDALEKGFESHQAIIVLSDGEDLGGEWEKGAEEARSRKIRVYTVGYGTPEGAKITIKENGKETFLKDENGKEVVSRLREDVLSKVAQITGGDYLRAASFPLPLDEIFKKRIKAIKRREFKEKKRRVPWNRYQWPLSIAVFLLLARLFLPEARRQVE